MSFDDRVEQLREWLRNPELAIGGGASVALHRQQLDDIWQEALRIAEGDIAEALRIATIATDTDASHASGESRDKRDGRAYHLFLDRQDGIPSRAFGAHGIFEGEDKVKHFFRCAELAYLTHFESGVRFAGKAYEAWNWMRSLPKGDGYDDGDVWADNLGAAFGMMLVDDPYASIYRFLQSPNQDVLVIEGGSIYQGDYIAEILVPSPLEMRRGGTVELRMIDRDGRPYVIVVESSEDGQNIRYERAGTSRYFVGRGDPWYYRSTPERVREYPQVRAPSATADERELRREIKTQNNLLDRLLDQQAENLRMQDRIQRQLQDTQSEAVRRGLLEKTQNLEQWFQHHEERQARIQENLNRLHTQVEEMRAHRGEHTLNSIHDSTAAQARAQILHRQEEERREREQREREQREREQRERDRELREREREREQRERDREQRERDQRRAPDPPPSPFVA